MKKFILYDVNSSKTVDMALDNLINMFNDLEDVAESVNYNDDDDRETYKSYVKSLRSYYVQCEKLLLNSSD